MTPLFKCSTGLRPFIWAVATFYKVSQSHIGTMWTTLNVQLTSVENCFLKVNKIFQVLLEFRLGDLVRFFVKILLPSFLITCFSQICLMSVHSEKKKDMKRRNSFSCDVGEKLANKLSLRNKNLHEYHQAICHFACMSFFLLLFKGGPTPTSYSFSFVFLCRKLF